MLPWLNLAQVLSCHCVSWQIWLVQPDGGLVNEATAARIAALQKDLTQKLGALEDSSMQNEALSSDNEALRGELERVGDRMQTLQQDHATTQVGSPEECWGTEVLKYQQAIKACVCLPWCCPYQGIHSGIHRSLGQIAWQVPSPCSGQLMRDLKRQRQSPGFLTCRHDCIRCSSCT